MSPFKTLVSVACFYVGLHAAGINAAAQGAGPGNPATSDARANELQSRYMTAAKVELTSKLDAKNAAVGQTVTAKTLTVVTLADGKVIPAGTKLMGRVVGVRPHSEEKPGSILAITFDMAEMKDGKPMPVRSLIRGIAPAGGAVASAAIVGPMGRDSDLTGAGFGGVPNSRGGITGGGIGGGGLDPSMGGGVGGGPVPGQGGQIGGVDPTMGGGVPVPGQGRQPNGNNRPITRQTIRVPVESAPAPVLKTSEGGEMVNPAPRPTGVPGVMLIANPASDVSGTLTEFGRNIHLDSGTQITLGLIAR